MNVFMKKGCKRMSSQTGHNLEENRKKAPQKSTTTGD